MDREPWAWANWAAWAVALGVVLGATILPPSWPSGILPWAADDPEPAMPPAADVPERIPPPFEVFVPPSAPAAPTGGEEPDILPPDPPAGVEVAAGLEPRPRARAEAAVGDVVAVEASVDVPDLAVDADVNVADAVDVSLSADDAPAVQAHVQVADLNVEADVAPMKVEVDARLVETDIGPTEVVRDVGDVVGPAVDDVAGILG